MGEPPSPGIYHRTRAMLASVVEEAMNEQWVNATASKTLVQLKEQAQGALSPVLPNLELVSFLVKNCHSNLNAKNSRNQTALYMAACLYVKQDTTPQDRKVLSAIMICLLESGARQSDREGENPLKLIESYHHKSSYTEQSCQEAKALVERLKNSYKDDTAIDDYCSKNGGKAQLLQWIESKNTMDSEPSLIVRDKNRRTSSV